MATKIASGSSNAIPQLYLESLRNYKNYDRAQHFTTSRIRAEVEECKYCTIVWGLCKALVKLYLRTQGGETLANFRKLLPKYFKIKTDAWVLNNLSLKFFSVAWWLSYEFMKIIVRIVAEACVTLENRLIDSGVYTCGILKHH